MKKKIVCLLFLCICAGLVTNIGRSYCIVFPLGVLIATYRSSIQIVLDFLYAKSTILYLLFAVTLLASFLIPINDIGFPRIIRMGLNFIHPMFLVSGFAMLIPMIDRMKHVSTFLLFLGNYSFEIYLLHFPFMVHYRFLDNPLWIYLPTYFVFVVAISVLLKKITQLTNNIIFPANNSSGRRMRPDCA